MDSLNKEGKLELLNHFSRETISAFIAALDDTWTTKEDYQKLYYLAHDVLKDEDLARTFMFR